MTNFLEASPGNKSNSRRIAWYAFIFGLVFMQEIIGVGVYEFIKQGSEAKMSLMEIVLAGGAAFTAVAGSAMVFAFSQKAQEPKDIANESKNS